MDLPLVSIIVSCYNAEKYVKETLKSLLNQTYQNLEIIIVNDGSTDQSEQIIKAFKDERIQYFKQNNKGQCAALNYGFSKSSGQYIKFYDADDLLHAEAIEGQVDSLTGTSFYDISFIEWRRFFNNIVPAAIDASRPHTIHRDCTPLEYITHQGRLQMFQCGLWLIPRKLINRAGLWNEQLSLINDSEYFSRLLSKANQLHFSHKGYTLYRTNVGSTSLSADFSSKGIRSAIMSNDLTARSYLSIENSERIKRLIVQSYSMTLDLAFPKHKIYSRLIEKRIRSYTNEPIELRTSGKIYNTITKLFGWKVAKHLSFQYYKYIIKRHF